MSQLTYPSALAHKLIRQALLQPQLVAACSTVEGSDKGWVDDASGGPERPGSSFPENVRVSGTIYMCRKRGGAC